MKAHEEAVPEKADDDPLPNVGSTPKPYSNDFGGAQTPLSRSAERRLSLRSIRSLPIRVIPDEDTQGSESSMNLHENHDQDLGNRMDSMSLPLERQIMDDDFLKPDEEWGDWVREHWNREFLPNDREYRRTRNKWMRTILSLDKRRPRPRGKITNPPKEIELVVDPAPAALIASSHHHHRQSSENNKELQPNVRVTGHHIVCFPPYSWKGFFAHLLPIILAIIIIVVFALPLPIMNGMPQARKCLGILISVAILWSTEAIPAFATALLIPIPVVLLQVLVSGTCSNSGDKIELGCSADNVCQTYIGPDSICEYTKPLPRYEAATVIFQQYFGPIIMLILCVFAIAAALRKTELDHRLSRFILHRAGTRPPIIMLVMMLLGWFLSMWVSNITATVITVSLISPILKTLSSEEPYSRCILLGIAFTCNIAGMTTPIASPQNLLAINGLSSATNVSITFPEWMAVACTTSLIGIICVFFFLWWFFKPTVAKIVPPTWQPQPVGAKHFFVIAVTLLTIGVWCAGTTNAVKEVIGDVAVVGLVPVVLFYGSGLLSRHDYQLIPWEVLTLMGGGLALGYAIIKSRLLYGMSLYFETIVGNHVYVAILTFGMLVWLFSNFVSHTAAAAIVMPVMASIGQALGHPRKLVLLTVMLDSAACALPISGFPNTITFAERNDDGDRYLNFKDYLKTGVPVGIFMIVLVNSLGYGLATALNM